MGPPMGPPRPPGGMGGSMPGLPLGGGTGGNRSESQVSYMSIEEATKLNLPPAVAVYPIRLAIIQMSFPLKDQLEEIKQALRLRNLWEARHESSPATIAGRSGTGLPTTGGPLGGGFPGPTGGPTMPMGGPMGPTMPGGSTGASNLNSIDVDTAPAFMGLVVERLTIPPEGLSANLTKEQYESLWSPLDHQERFFSRFTRYDAPFVKEEGYKPYFLRPEQGVSAPLPVLADGFALNYPPDTTMGTIYTNYKHLEDTKAQKKTADELLKKYNRGSTNPYSAPPPATGSFGGGFGDEGMKPPGMGGMAGMAGMGGPSGYNGGGFRPPTGGMAPPMSPDGDPENPGAGGAPAAQTNLNKLDVDHLLMRFLDEDLVPGNTYQYRVKVLMKSPNYKNKDNVSDINIASVEILESAWYELPQTLTVPRESFLYAYPAKKYEESVTKIYEESGKPEAIRKVAELQEVKEGKRAVIQVQQWMDRLRLGSRQEPIGAFVQAEMPVAVGEFVGRRVPVELPLWRSAALSYVLPHGDTKTSIYPNWPRDTNNNKYTLPKTRVLDFRTRNVLVDFEGGHTNTKVGTTTLADESMADLLILREDGRIEVRSEGIDMVENVLPTPPTPRALRDKAWHDWLERIRKKVDTDATTGSGMGPLGNGGRPGGDGGDR